MFSKKAILLIAALALTVAPSFAKSAGKSSAPVRVKGYTKKDGTVVAPARRTAPDKTENNNWTTKGNSNPDTGKAGTKTPKK